MIFSGNISNMKNRIFSRRCSRAAAQCLCCMQMLDFIYTKLGEVGWYEYREPAALHQSNILIKCPLKSCNKNFSPRSIGKFVLHITTYHQGSLVWKERVPNWGLLTHYIHHCCHYTGHSASFAWGNICFPN